MKTKVLQLWLHQQAERGKAESQREFAERVGVTVVTVHDWLYHDLAFTKPRTERKFCAALGCRRWELFEDGE